MANIGPVNTLLRRVTACTQIGINRLGGIRNMVRKSQLLTKRFFPAHLLLTVNNIT